ncbi:MAG TPA: UDP-N-acetylmuramoyl-L-alanine--D-glutamate ligase, partial [bacterium]|nr:UDP-N-acetylmuramoyl-L-alanine--D-glutamate ligase [bacterium]
RTKQILVVGMGETGWATARYLKKSGACVRVTEQANTPQLQEKARRLKEQGIEVELGQHTEGFVRDSDLVVTSPGVPPESLPLKLALAAGKPVWSEVEIAWRLSPTRKVIAVTGTNGKTTTTSLLGFLLKQCRWPHLICGNIGNPFIGELDKLTADTWVVLEVSSFQLEYIEQFKPLVGVLLNITPDHLDRYPSFEEYALTKLRLFSRQGEEDWAVINHDDVFCFSRSQHISSRKLFFSLIPGKADLWYERESIWLKQPVKQEVCSLRGANLFGTGNLQNMLAVAGVSLILRIGRGVLEKTLQDFRPLAHRMEKVADINGVSFVNDSKSTNVDSVRKALETFAPGSVILIMGGKDKGFSFAELCPLVKEKVSYLLLLGETAKKIAADLEASGVRVEFVSSLSEAVQKGYQQARPGKTVLLSPGCSSFDMFTNYKERGDVFKKTVQALLSAVRG